MILIHQIQLKFVQSYHCPPIFAYSFPRIWSKLHMSITFINIQTPVDSRLDRPKVKVTHEGQRSNLCKCIIVRQFMDTVFNGFGRNFTCILHPSISRHQSIVDLIDPRSRSHMGVKDQMCANLSLSANFWLQFSTDLVETSHVHYTHQHLDTSRQST